MRITYFARVNNKSKEKQATEATEAGVDWYSVAQGLEVDNTSVSLKVWIGPN